MKPIRGIHFADFHLGGAEQIGPLDPITRLNGRVMDFLDALDALAEFADENDADIIIFAGDAFHRHNPEPTLVREFGERIIKMAEHRPVVLLLGNHDIPGSMERASVLDLFQTLKADNVIVGWDYQLHLVKTQRGMVQVATVPYPIRQQLLTDKELRLPIDKVHTLVQQRIEGIIHDLASEVDEEIPSILVGHFSVSQARYGAERDMIVGADATVRLMSLIEPNVWDYVALGHIHYHQDMTADMEEKEELDLPPIVYAGSLERVNFGEEHEDKGFVWFEIGDKTTCEFIQTDARPYRSIEIDVYGKDRQTERIAHKISKMNLKGAVVKLRVVTDETTKVRRQDIYKILESSGAYCIHSLVIHQDEYERSPEEELSLDGVPITALSNRDKIRLYFSLVGIEDKGVLKLADEIMNEVDDERRP